MKKLLIVLAVLLLAGAGYFTYDKWVKHAGLTAWSFVPSDAAVVFETRLTEDLDELRGFQIWKNLKAAEGYKSVEEALSFLDSINGDGGFSTVFNRVPTLVSMHRVSSSSFDFLFVADIQNLSQNTFISVSVARLREAGYRFKTRNYRGFKISEIGEENETITFIFYKNFFLISTTPYLVEDAIRTIDDTDVRSYAEVFSVDRQSSTHVNYAELENLMNVFSQSPIDLPTGSGSYRFSIDSTFLNFTGFSEAKGLLSTHQEAPGPFEMTQVIPSNTASFLHFSNNDISSWTERMIEHLSKDEATKKLLDSLKQALDFDPRQVYDLVDDELGLALLESGRPDDGRKLFIIKVKDTSEALRYFRQLSERLAYARGDTVYSESYSDNEIRFLPISNFPKTMLGTLADGFDRCFYLSHQNYIVFSNNLQELRSFVATIQAENTWGKSILMNNFLERSMQEANVSLFVSIPRFWPQFTSLLKPNWKTHFRSHEQRYQNVELAAFQFSYLDGNYFTSYTLSQPRIAKVTTTKTSSDNAITFSHPVITKPFLVRTHAHRNFDIFVQDSTFVTYFLDQSFSAMWSKELEAPIVSDVYELDYYRNGKIQYAFATSSSIHVIDRTGSYIPGFPKTIAKASSIQHFNVIDYDRSRNYRLAITDNDGKVFLTDKDVNTLEGWDPIPYTRPAIKPLDHIRVAGKDVMLSIQENGVINLTNRRGQRQSGFPFDTKTDLADDYYLSTSNSLGASSLSLMSKQGELLEVNLEGIVINRDQLIKESPEADFQLVSDRAGKSFVIVRKDGNTYDVLDATGNLLFSKDYLSTDVLVQYYQLGAGKDLVVFADTGNESLYIFDKAGQLVTGSPLRAGFEVGILYSSSKKELQVFTTSGSNMEFYTLNY